MKTSDIKKHTIIVETFVKEKRLYLILRTKGQYCDFIEMLEGSIYVNRNVVKTVFNFDRRDKILR